MKLNQIALSLSLIVGLCAPSSAYDGVDPGQYPTGLPLPRFASLRVEPVNLRTGPGTRYPIEWVYMQDGIPLEITAEFDIWRRVRDWEGSEGWLHKNALSGKRTAILCYSNKELKLAPTETSPTVAIVEQGTIGSIVSCTDTWCELKIKDVSGYLQKTDFWGTYSSEAFKG